MNSMYSQLLKPNPFGRPLSSLTLALLSFVILVSFWAGAVALAEDETFVFVENRSGQIAKIAVPGGKPTRIAADSEPVKIMIMPTKRNGVEAKAWWVSDARQLCVIFVRYEGKIIIAGKDDIRCLGN